MKKKLILYVILFIAVIMVTSNIYALSGSMSLSSSSVTIGSNITVSYTINNGASWQYNISYDSSKLQYVSGNLSYADTSSSGNNVTQKIATVVFKTKATGSTTISISGKIVDQDFNTSSINQSKPVTIKEKTTTTNTNTPTTTTTTKSSNANLKSMSVNVEGLSPAFSKSKTAYSLNVGETVTSVKVSAAVENSKASYVVSGNKDLKVGENIIKITVTAENGTKKVYKITVLKSDDPANTDATLANLIIENVNIGDFDPNNTEYSAGDLKVTSKLNILAYPNSDGAKYEIIGNDKFVKGENKVVIRVTSTSGTITKDYTITFNNTVDPNDSNSYTEVDPYVDPYTETSGNDVNNWNADFDKVFDIIKENATIILLYLLALIEFLQVVYLYMQLKKVSPEVLVVKRRKGNEKEE